MTFYPRRVISRLLAVVALLGVSATGETIRAEDLGEGNAPEERPADAPVRRCDPVDGERLAFLESRLEDNAPYARWWWRGWTGVYVGGMAFEGTRAALEDDRGKRANSIASAVKSTIGLTRAVLSQPEAKRGVADWADLPLDDPASCRDRLELAEERLRESAEQAEKERWSWIPHLFNFGLNAAGAVVVAESYDEDSAYWSGALGFAVGEIRIWSYPWHAEDDWKTYRRRFAAKPRAEPPETTLHLEPMPNGARLVVRF